MVTLAPENTAIIDEWVDAPEGSKPEKLHILFNANAREFADQYSSVLHISRQIPFNISAVPMSDPLCLIIARLYNLTEGDKARQIAISHYEKWSYDAQRHAWILALLEDNEFVNTPTPYMNTGKTPRGVIGIPEPAHDLSNTVEYRLKQIMDYLATNVDFQLRVMSAINSALAKLVNEAEETDTRTGFQPVTVDGNVHAADVAVSSNNRVRPTKRATKTPAISSNIIPLGEATENPDSE